MFLLVGLIMGERVVVREQRFINLIKTFKGFPMSGLGVLIHGCRTVHPRNMACCKSGNGKEVDCLPTFYQGLLNGYHASY